jgi:hypothetical protein
MPPGCALGLGRHSHAALGHSAKGWAARWQPRCRCATARARSRQLAQGQGVRTTCHQGETLGTAGSCARGPTGWTMRRLHSLEPPPGGARNPSRNASSALRTRTPGRCGPQDSSPGGGAEKQPGTLVGRVNPMANTKQGGAGVATCCADPSPASPRPPWPALGLGSGLECPRRRLPIRQPLPN